jgi:hypothetical protein
MASRQWADIPLNDCFHPTEATPAHVQRMIGIRPSCRVSAAANGLYPSPLAFYEKCSKPSSLERKGKLESGFVEVICKRSLDPTYAA